MKKYNPSNTSIHVLSRALIIQNESVLICKHKDHRFLPGGHVENGESLVEALKREFVEELGTFSYSIPKHIGVCDHKFTEKDVSIQHEVNHIFITHVESNIEFEKQRIISFV